MLDRYLTDDEENVLAPFSSPAMLRLACNGLWLVVPVLLISWPRMPDWRYFESDTIPLCFLITSISVLLMVCHINLRAGRGEVVTKNDYRRMMLHSSIRSGEEKDFVSFGLVGFLIHIVFLCLLFFPFIVVSAALSGISGNGLIAAALVVFVSAWFWRLYTFFTYLVFDRTKMFGYYLNRVFFLFIFTVSTFVYPNINPIYIMYIIHRGELNPLAFRINPFWIFIIPYTAVSMALGYTNYRLTKKKVFSEPVGHE